MMTEEERRAERNARRRQRYHEGRNETFIERNWDILREYSDSDRALLKRADFVRRSANGLDAAIIECVLDNAMAGQPMRGWRDDATVVVSRYPACAA